MMLMICSNLFLSILTSSYFQPWAFSCKSYCFRFQFSKIFFSRSSSFSFFLRSLSSQIYLSYYINRVDYYSSEIGIYSLDLQGALSSIYSATSYSQGQIYLHSMATNSQLEGVLMVGSSLKMDLFSIGCQGSSQIFQLMLLTFLNSTLSCITVSFSGVIPKSLKSSSSSTSSCTLFLGLV